jgi:hypothetical protein
MKPGILSVNHKPSPCPMWLLPFRVFQKQAPKILLRLSNWTFLRNHGFDGKSRKIASPPRLRWVDLTSSSCSGEWWRVYRTMAKEFCYSLSSGESGLSDPTPRSPKKSRARVYRWEKRLQWRMRTIVWEPGHFMDGEPRKKCETIKLLNFLNFETDTIRTHNADIFCWCGWVLDTEYDRFIRLTQNMSKCSGINWDIWTSKV